MPTQPTSTAAVTCPSQSTPSEHAAYNMAGTLALLTLLFIAACGDNQDPSGAQALWKSIHAQEYRSWQHAPGYDTKRKSNAPHGDEVIIYINDVLAQTLAQGGAIAAWPEGSRIVKDGFDGSDLELVAVMEKQANGWYWAEYDADGDPSFSGKPDLCLDCHRSGDDYVRAFSFPR